jgi:hypothetical protein
MIEQKLDLVRTPCGMYRRIGVVPHGLVVLFLFLLFGVFQSHFLAIFMWWFSDLSLWDSVRDVCLIPS